MFGLKSSKSTRGRDDGEKPFWISFSDLMSALMVLFLVSMAVALMAVTQKQKTIDDTTERRNKTIEQCLAAVKDVTDKPQFRGVTVSGNSINFEKVVEFALDKHSFSKPADEKFIRAFVPEVLKVARTQDCEAWLKRVVVEGFASRSGGYLYNLNLSYLRSQRVLCALLNSQVTDALSEADRKLIQTLFLVGGSSFNTADNGGASSMQRVEIKLEFREVGSKAEPVPDLLLDPGTICPNP
jgi:outer membrane protein OmpA-like peptidoglycan-associated protein